MTQNHVRLNAMILYTLRTFAGGKNLTVGQLLERVRKDDLQASVSSSTSDALAPSLLTSSISTTTIMTDVQSRIPANSLDFSPGPFFKRIQTLNDLGLVSLGRRGLLVRDNLRRIVSIAPKFIELQAELGFSLTDTWRRGQDTINITPSFPAPTQVAIDVFVIMPFSKELEPTYAAIRDVCGKLSLNVIRGNELFEATHVINDIWSAICSAKIIICDCSGRNPNVFYELGIAHTLGKKVLLLTQQEGDIPFDLRHWRHLIYNKPDELFRNSLLSGVARYISTPGSSSLSKDSSLKAPTTDKAHRFERKTPANQ